MRFIKFLALSALTSAPISVANAALVVALGSNSGAYLSLSASGLSGSGGQVAALSGGMIYTQDMPFADIPKGNLYQNTFLAAGVQAGEPATLTFTAPTNYLSFLWGSPDTYNVLTVATNLMTYTFNPVSLGFATTDGNQAISQYVSFTGTAGETIGSVSFNNLPAQDAFEAGNFSVTAVPEPASWALMVAGFALLGATMRRRQPSGSFA